MCESWGRSRSERRLRSGPELDDGAGMSVRRGWMVLCLGVLVEAIARRSGLRRINEVMFVVWWRMEERVWRGFGRGRKS
jgi:hypothetical protein